MSKLPYPLDKGGTHWEGCHRTTHHHNCAVLRCDNHESTIAELRERHEAFVRKIREQAGDERFTDAYSINRIIALCDAELSGEQSNG